MTADVAIPALLTDLYQFTMLRGYLERGLRAPAVFELTVRTLPEHRNFLIAAGLEQFLWHLEHLRFSPAELDWLRQRGLGSRLVDYLRDFRFTGDVRAMPEGTIFFPDEPILRVTAPLPEAQLLETIAINLLHFQSLIASKAVRMVLAAPGKQLVDFGLRRAHSAESGLLAARAAYLAGFAGTATVAAAQLWEIPVFGTMAHSFVEAHDDESQAFLTFARANPGDATLLLDTYDVESAAHKAVAVAKTLAAEGISLAGVRLDSGDLAADARHVRLILDQGGLASVRIVASGGLDEYSLAELVAQRAPIDGFGVGTRLDVSADAPYLDCAYKLQEYAGRPRRKKSKGKSTWPGRKQVWRQQGADGLFSRDQITLEDDTSCQGAPLLECVVRQGRRVGPPPSLGDIRARVAEQLTRLPEALKSLGTAKAYPVEIMPPLRELAAGMDRAAGLAVGD